jgi:hypothetical protein
MAKSRKNRSSSILKNITKTTVSAFPVVGKGLTKVGDVAKGVASKSAPVVERGVSSVYGTLASGFNLGAKSLSLGAKGLKSVAKGVSKKRRSKNRKGGRKSRRY